MQMSLNQSRQFFFLDFGELLVYVLRAFSLIKVCILLKKGKKKGKSSERQKADERKAQRESCIRQIERSNREVKWLAIRIRKVDSFNLKIYKIKIVIFLI